MTLLTVMGTSPLAQHVKHLNIKCDFESIPGGGCHLRESYCSMHNCVCKPDYPINIADRLCIAKYKSVGQSCTYSQECQTGSFCTSIATGNHEHSVCQCKTGYVYSTLSEKCTKGIKDSACTSDKDCSKDNMFCSLSTCDCKYGFQWLNNQELCYKKSKYGEPCIDSMNCKLHDEFSECDVATRTCSCGQFLSRKYALDELIHKCVSCPLERYQNASNTCVSEKTIVQYSLLDTSSYGRNNHQYVYLVLSLTPFVVFALIGVIFRFVNPNMLAENGGAVVPGHSEQLVTISCLRTETSQWNRLCSTVTVRVDPPPSYDHTFKDLPPTYEEATRSVAR